jgi:hypothetical protein
MKKIGFFGVADATTLRGDVTLAPSVGFVTVSGKSFEPAGGGVASGAGNCWLFCGVHVMGTGGVGGYEGGVVGGGVGAGVGVGVGVGIGVGVVGVEVVLMLFDVPLHPAIDKLTANRADIPQTIRTFRKAGESARIYEPPVSDSRRGTRVGSGERLGSPRQASF